jgi:hypothetical protein
MAETDYRSVLHLSSLLQLEQRVRIRAALAHTLAVLCAFDAHVVHVLLPTMLPVDIALAILNAAFAGRCLATGVCNIQQILYRIAICRACVNDTYVSVQYWRRPAVRPLWLEHECVD